VQTQTSQGFSSRSNFRSGDPDEKDLNLSIIDDLYDDR